MTAEPTWLETATGALHAAWRSGRLPHALLLHEDPGAGGEWLARWAAQLVLCERGVAAPCGACAACRAAGATQHPDLAWLRPQEESRQIRIEQVRDLASDLALTSHAGGYKVAVVSPADALNRFAANALLKTVEEPAPRTLLVLVTAQPARLPATLRSRCQRLRVRSPDRLQAVEWLTKARGAGDWPAVLEALGAGPMVALGVDPAAVADVGRESRETLESLCSGSTDPVTAAERWSRSELELRLGCFEKWLTEHVHRRALAGSFLREMRAASYLPEAGAFLNIRELFGLVDAVRDMRATLDVPLNRGLALEALFRRLAPAGSGRGRGQG